MGWVVVLLIASGCGRLGFDATRLDADGGTDASGEAGTDAACGWTAFSQLQRVPAPVQSGADEWAATLFLGDTRMMFHRYATTNSDLFVASRATTGDAFANVVPVTELNTTANQWTPSLSEDGLFIMYAQLSGSFELMAASRASVGQTFTAPLTLTSLNSPADDFSPALSPDGLRVVFASKRNAGSASLFEASRPDRSSPFGAPVPIDLGIGDAQDPTLSSDQLELFFVSNRTGGLGRWDVWTARRPAIGQPFGPAVHVPELSSARDEVCMRLAADGSRIFLNYDTLTAGGGAADIWTATRACL